MTSKRWPALAWWTGAVAWMGVIFTLSAQAGAQSSGLSGLVVGVVENVLSGLGLHPDHDTLQLVVRKGAHVLAYLVLGAVLTQAWHRWPDHRADGPEHRADRPEHQPARSHHSPARSHHSPDRSDHSPARSRALRRNLVAPTLIAILYAVTDEIHQHFVPGRDGRATDVLIDAAGVVVGVCLVAAARRHASRRR
jgi:VanZ family protein